MPTSPNLHLRGFRKRSALTQSDVSHLLGHVSSSPISRLESGEQAPDFRSALSLELVFGAFVNQLFRDQFRQLATRVRDRAGVLGDSVALQTDSAEVRRRRSELKAIVARIDRLLS